MQENQTTELADLAHFFRTAQWPVETARHPTFFSIAGFPHYENVMSNVYQFFFNADNPHGLATLCVDALLDVFAAKHTELPWQGRPFKNPHVRREVGMHNQQRLDLLLHNGSLAEDWSDASAIILIENKVYHWLANDLNNYWESVTNANPNAEKIGIVLGLRREWPLQPWVFISHIEWAVAVEKRLGALVYRAEPRYLTLLLELIENIRTMTDNDESFADMMDFFQQNRVAITRAEQIRSTTMGRFPSVLRDTLASGYELKWNAAGKQEGWLWISRPGGQKYSYVLGYYAVFYGDESQPNYRIELQGNYSGEAAKVLQANLLATDHAQAHKIEAANDATHHVIGRTYSLSLSDYARLPQLIAETLRNEWQPLEQYWLDASE